MDKLARLKTIDEYHKIMDSILLELNKTQIIIKYDGKKKSEILAEEYYRKKGYTVYRSRVRNGYRIIGARYYWKEWEEVLNNTDKEIINTLLNILGEKKLRELAYLTKDKNGCPDLMLIKDNKIQFVEVKTNNEEIKMATCEWFIKNENKYPISILRVKK